MDWLLRALSFVFGLGIVVSAFTSAISMFVLPRAAPNQVVRLVFGLSRRVFEFAMRKVITYQQRDQIMAYYAPVSLMLLVPVWYILVIVGYLFMYRAAGINEWDVAFRLSGSSILTLGFEASKDFWVDLLMFSEALLGLTLVALLIAYLPSMYSAFERREALVNRLEVRAGSPPAVLDMLSRYQRIHGLDRLVTVWVDWENWFVEVEESHTTLPPLVFFRSPRPEQSWVTAAGAVLDSAAFTLSTVETPYTPEAALCIRAGYLALRRVADTLGISYPPDPHYPGTPVSIRQEEFDALYDQLAAQGIALKTDRQQAWHDFAGWRVNYDRVLLELAALTMAPRAPWSSDRAPALKLPPLMPKGAGKE